MLNNTLPTDKEGALILNVYSDANIFSDIRHILRYRNKIIRIVTSVAAMHYRYMPEICSLVILSEMTVQNLKTPSC